MIHSLLEKRFNGTNNLIYMATSYHHIPSIRSLTPYYHDGAFYALTSGSSKKINEIKENPYVAICGYFFNASAIASNIGQAKNHPELSIKLMIYCKDWIQLGNVDMNSEDTCILKIQITKGYLIEKDKRYEIDFS